MNNDMQLVRLENCLWGFKPLETAVVAEVSRRYSDERSYLLEGNEKKTEKSNCNHKIFKTRLKTPQNEPHFSFKIANLVIPIFHNLPTYASHGKSFVLDCRSVDKDITGRWRIKRYDVVVDCSQKCKQYIPFTKKKIDEKVVTYSIERDKSSSCCLKIRDKVVELTAVTLVGPLNSEYLTANETLLERLKRKSFSDLYTVLATNYFQSFESNFIPEARLKGDFCYIINDVNQLRLVKKEHNELTNEELDDNRCVVQHYRNFVIEEYGCEYVNYVETNYGFNLTKMEQDGTPLLADHVFKMNIGVNNIELSHIKSLYKKLVNLKGFIETSDKSYQEYYVWKGKNELRNNEGFGQTQNAFTIRELRSIHRKLGDESKYADLFKYLNNLVKEEIDSPQDLKSEQFNEIVEIIMPTSKERHRAFTGRDIRHLAICGYHTMGNSNVPSPSRDLFELLHIFSDLELKGDWKSYYELLGHVVAKKSLFRGVSSHDNVVDKWRCGVLIPAPTSREGERRWYYNDSFHDDRRGSVNYVLLPACHDYNDDKKPLPMIKLYGSTASNRNMISCHDSSASPNLNVLFNYENIQFDRRTIPVWVGYLLLAKNLKDLNSLSYAVNLNKAIEWYKDDQHDHHEFSIYEQGNDEDKYKFLLAKAQALGELSDKKIAQDIVYVGHSLGGSFAQFGKHQFGPERKRIPLPGATFRCFTYCSHAIGENVNARYMAFGRSHKDLILGLGQKWKIHYQFEYGDVIPKDGGAHLGTVGYNIEEDSWLEVTCSLFKPKEEAEELSITTMPTHERRIGLAVRDRDYELTEFNPKTLYDFNHSLRLNSEIKKIFGYKALMSPKATDEVRKFCESVSKPILSCAKRIYHLRHPVLEDEEDIFHLQYKEEAYT